MRQAVKIELTDEERTTLESWKQGQCVEVRQALQARITLLSVDRMQTKDIAVHDDEIVLPRNGLRVWDRI